MPTKRKWLLMMLPLTIILAIFEFQRALGGNSRSWLYVIEWPFFGLFTYYMYWKLSQPRRPWESYEEEDDSPSDGVARGN